MATGIYYFNNLNIATAAYNSGSTPNVDFALYHDSSLSNPVLNWNGIIKNGLDNNYSPGSNIFGWTIAYSDLNTVGTLEADGSWIKATGSSALSGGADVTSGRYATATILILCPAFYDNSTTFNVGPPASGLIPMYTGVISYQTTGKTPITNTPDLITASGLTSGDASTFYSAPSLSTSTDRWKVSQRFFLNGTSTSLNTLVSSNSLVDLTNVSSTYTQSATVYFLTKVSAVYALSFYANLTDANAGIANNDNYFDISGGSAGRIAYGGLGVTDVVATGGDISGYTSWNLLSEAGNPYINPINTNSALPAGTTNWYLYPYVVGAYFSYYNDASGANAGVANNDELYDASGGSAGRIAYSAASSATAIGTVVDGSGNISGITSWNVLDTSGNLLAGGPYDNAEDSTDFSPASGSLAFFLYPYSLVTVVLSYYINSTNATSGRTNNDGATISSVGGTSGNRIAYSEIGSLIGDVDASGGTIGIYDSWKVIDSTGNLLSGHYNNGVDISTLGELTQPLYLYPYVAPGPAAPCFLEGSQILCLVDEKETYLPIEKMRKGTLVKTLNSGYKMVHIIGKRDIPNFNDSARIKDRLYKLTSAQYPALTSDLYLTGCHSTLVDSLTEEQKEEIKKMLGVVCVTEGKYRLPSCLDNNAEPWQSKGTYTVWHFALDDEDPLINFGVYANGGLIVETGSIRYLQGKANMELV